jgi:hypothetical protein
MKKIDIHMHCFKHRPLPLIGTENTIMIPDEVFALYDEMEVEHGILLPIVSPDCSTSVQGNEEVEEICQNSGGRLLWFCNIDPRNYSNSPDSDLSRMLKAYKARGALGVGEIVSNLPFDDPLMENLFFHCQKQKMPVLFHIAPERVGYYGIYDEVGLYRLEKELVKFPELMFIGHSQPFWAEISSNVTSESRNTYPQGNVAPGRVVELMRKYPNLHGDLSANSGFNAVKRDEAFGCSFIEEFQDRLFFGTDICTAAQRIGLSAWLDEKYAEGKISKDAYYKVSRGNAERLLLKKSF